MWARRGRRRFVFTDEIGRPLHPQQVSDQFYLLVFQVGLPPVRLHDLRRGAASRLSSTPQRPAPRPGREQPCVP
jgi:hypothetical protein